ncbi:MAG: diguanylate cyclase, partial [Calditrichaeota bacterium]|nr:diguanylate cyclase [Calditrichota bacterium]
KFGASIIISEDTRNGLADPAKYQHRFLGKVQVKGKDQAVSIFEIYDAEPERLLELKTQTRDNFELGLKHYFNRQFADAVVAFKKVLDVNPSDRTAVLYLENSAQFVVQGVPTDWQGIETMDSK